MVGEIIFTGQDGYVETVELEHGSTRLIDCGGSVLPLFRLDWTDYRGNAQHTAFYSWDDAAANFERRAAGE